MHGIRQAIRRLCTRSRRPRAKQVLNCLTLETVDGRAPTISRATQPRQLAMSLPIHRNEEWRKTRRHAAQAIGLAIAKRGDAARAMRGANTVMASLRDVARQGSGQPASQRLHAELSGPHRQEARCGNGKTHDPVLNETEMKRLGMGSLLSVTAGTTEPRKLIVMQYKGKAVRTSRWFSLARASPSIPVASR